jgi:hypothetical protein
MNKQSKQSATQEGGMEKEQTGRPSHWLYTIDVETYEYACEEITRLQRTIRLLIAIDCCTEAKASHAYEIAGWK